MFRARFAVQAALFLLASLSLRATAQTLVATVTSGQYPIAAAVNPVTNKIYVANQNSNSVTVIDGATQQTATVLSGGSPDAVAVNAITNKVYVVNANGTITVIDGQSNRTSSVSAGSYPVAIAVNATTNKIYVANNSSNTVTVVDGATLQTQSVTVGQHPSAITVNTTTNKVFVADATSNAVTQIDGATNATITIAVQSRPLAIAVNPATNLVYVANYRSSTVSVIDPTTDSVISTVSVGLLPCAIAVDAIRNRVYVANAGDNTATIFDGTTLATTTVNVGATPVALVFDDVTNKAYLADSSLAGAMTMIDGASGSATNLAVGEYPIALAANVTSNRIYVLNSGSNSVSIIAGAPAAPLQFMASVPCRLVDTRGPLGQFGGPAIAGGTSRSFALAQAPSCNIPASAVAYSLNVTVVPHGPLGYLTVWPAGEVQPTVSTLNSDGRTKANAAIVPAGAAGAISVYAPQTTDVILDIDGYFEPATGQSLQFYPLPPCRVVDTRNSNGSLAGPYLTGRTERDFPVLSSNCDIPNSAQAYVMNFTAVPWQNEGMGYLTVWPAGATQPVVSTLNNPTATLVANAAIVPAGTAGAIAVYPSADTHLVVDITGYFAPPGTGGLSLYPSAPCRVLDTRSSGGAFSGQRNPPVDVGDSSCGIPGSAQAYVLNATVVPVGTLGYLTLWPDGETMPLASTLNARDGVTASNMAALPNQDGYIDVYAAGTTQLIVDVFSYFAP